MDNRMDNEKKKYRFNAIDAIIIIAVVAVIAFCAYKMVSVSGNNPLKSSDTYRVKVEMKVMRIGFDEYFKPGDKIYDRTMNTEYGKIIDVSAAPSKNYTISAVDGTAKEVDVPDKCDITFILEIQSDDVIAVGQYITFKNNLAVGSGFALETELIEEASK